MTLSERNEKLKYFIACLKCEVSGKCCDDDCPIQYHAGATGEIIENLGAISNILEKNTESAIVDGDTIELVCCWGGDPRKRPHYIVKRIKEVQ